MVTALFNELYANGLVFLGRFFHGFMWKCRGKNELCPVLSLAKDFKIKIGNFFKKSYHKIFW